MNRKSLSQLALPLLGLLLIGLLALLNMNRSHTPQPLLEVSVILREDSTFSVTRQGMEQAAADLNVELRFLAPSVANSAPEQAQLLAHELESGASAVLLVPADREALSEAVQAAQSQAAVVTLETDMTGQGARAFLGADNQALGEALGRAAINGTPFGGTVLLLDSLPGDNAVRERLEASSAFLEREGRKVLIHRPEDPELQDYLPAHPVQAILAFDAPGLEKAAEAARTLEDFPLLYGAGSTPTIAAGLEQNRVTAIAALNNFSSGYLAVQTAAALVRRQPPPEPAPLPFRILRQETMYEPENQKLLFPVT